MSERTLTAQMCDYIREHEPVRSPALRAEFRVSNPAALLAGPVKAGYLVSCEVFGPAANGRLHKMIQYRIAEAARNRSYDEFCADRVRRASTTQAAEPAGPAKPPPQPVAVAVASSKAAPSHRMAPVFALDSTGRLVLDEDGTKIELNPAAALALADFLASVRPAIEAALANHPGATA